MASEILRLNKNSGSSSNEALQGKIIEAEAYGEEGYGDEYGEGYGAEYGEEYGAEE
jgi:hypothetical protein